MSQHLRRFPFIGLLFVCEGAAILCLLSIYRYSPIIGLSIFLQSPAGWLALATLTLFVGTGLLLLRIVRQFPPPAARQASLTLSLNLILILVTGLVAETSLRVLHELGMRIPRLEVPFPTLRSWERTAADFRAAIESTTTPFHQHDPELGWTIARNRLTADGLYASSQEGLRSGRPGETRLNWSSPGIHPAGRHQHRRRIALIGDSFTFGYEIPFDATWATRLATLTMPEEDFANFGVIGYSVNQMRLKYERDIRPLHPDVVIVGLISNDFLRDTYVYNFMRYPNMLALPYARPRPALRDGHLTVLNTPLPAPTEIFARASVHDLPYLAEDVNYSPVEWERAPWRWLQRSFLFRVLTAWPAGSSETRRASFEDEQHALNRAVLQAFMAAITAEGSTALFLFFPDRTELPDTPDLPQPVLRSYTVRLLEELGLPFIDTTPCVSTIPPERRFMPGQHYTPEVNAALASCLPEVLRAAIQGISASGRMMAAR